jgi:methionyl-tRNA formyltransferase
MPAKMPVLEVESANRNDCIKWIENIKPDYAFIYGTGIIGKKLLSLPSMGALNLHTGISPYYRGSDCAFWPLYKNDPLMLGSTVHKCTPELDGGDIFGRVSIRLSKDDDPYTAFAKAVEAGTSLYSNIAKRLVGGEEVPSEKQDFSKGKEYRFKDKTFVQELIMEFRVSSGKIEKIIADAEDSSLPFCDAK